jgi:hypothetical protein
MRELLDALLEAQQDDCETLTIEHNCGKRLKEFLEWIKDQAAMGTGITITAEDNGGEKKEIYIDGDGPDRIHDIK